jgi:hypothetical protein
LFGATVLQQFKLGAGTRDRAAQKKKGEERNGSHDGGENFQKIPRKQEKFKMA